MTITSSLMQVATDLAELPGDSVTTLIKTIGEATGLFGDGHEADVGVLTSVLAGIAAALAVGIWFTVYVRGEYWSGRAIASQALAAVVLLALVAFVLSDLRHAAFAYLGINPSKPAVEFEIRLPKAALSRIADTQIELHTDRNQKLARLESAEDGEDGRSVLRGSVPLDYRTADRVVILNLPGLAACEFRLRLAADPRRTVQFGPWHLADRVAPAGGAVAVSSEPRDAYAIRYRVL